MTLEGVPWFVDGGEHGPEVARVLAYCAMGGQEGVVAPTDFKVTASPIPDGNIHIGPGAIGMLNRSPGGESQAYVVLNVGDEPQAMTAQGSSGVRHDLVAIIVQDPDYAGQPAPASVENGPYARVKVYEGVAANTEHLYEVDADQTGYAIARVKFDQSDGTVHQTDITDLRKPLYSRSKTEMRMVSLPAGSATANMSTAGLATYPSGAQWEVEVPEWATKMKMSAVFSGMRMYDDGADGGEAGGTVRVDLGTVTTDAAAWYENAIGPGRNTTMTAATAKDGLTVPVGMRGTKQTLTAKAVKSSGAGMTAKQAPGTTVIVTVVFDEAVE